MQSISRLRDWHYHHHRRRIALRLNEIDDERGSAVLEFLLVGVLIIVPLFYLVVALARVQAGAYAVSQAAREAARSYVAAPTAADGSARARASAALAYRDQGFNGQGGLRVTCEPKCVSAGGTVTAATDLRVPLPLVPGFLTAVVPTSITVHASHTQAVPRFAERS